MKTHLLALGVGLGLGWGCGSTTSSTPSEQPKLDDTPHAEVSCADASAKSGDAKLDGVLLRHCTDDHWSADSRACMASAKTLDDRNACVGGMTNDQREALGKDLLATFGSDP